MFLLAWKLIASKLSLIPLKLQNYTITIKKKNTSVTKKNHRQQKINRLLTWLIIIEISMSKHSV